MQLWSDTSTEKTFYQITLNMPYGAECWATEKREVKAHIEELCMLRLMVKEGEVKNEHRSGNVHVAPAYNPRM